MDRRGNIKLCDFGISGQLVDSIAKTRDAGCRPYMAVCKQRRNSLRAWKLGTWLLSAEFCFVFFFCSSVVFQPERIDPSASRQGYDVRSDVWSLGITLVSQHFPQETPFFFVGQVWVELTPRWGKSCQSAVRLLSVWAGDRKVSLPEVE